MMIFKSLFLKIKICTTFYFIVTILFFFFKCMTICIYFYGTQNLCEIIILKNQNKYNQLSLLLFILLQQGVLFKTNEQLTNMSKCFRY